MLFLSCPVFSCPVLSFPVFSYPALSCPTLFCSVLFCPVLSYPVLPCPFLPCPALPCPVLSCSALPCPTLFFSVLFYSVLSCPIFFYLPFIIFLLLFFLMFPSSLSFLSCPLISSLTSTSTSISTLSQPNTAIRGYFGEHVAMYFSFMAYYVTSLAGLALVRVCIRTYICYDCVLAIEKNLIGLSELQRVAGKR